MGKRAGSPLILQSKGVRAMLHTYENQHKKQKKEHERK